MMDFKQKLESLTGASQAEGGRQAFIDESSPFSVLWTADGSPSLRGSDEPMHHLGGAYSETQYIYGDAIRRFQDQHTGQSPTKVLVVGLGLGYIELLATAESLKRGQSLELQSYEIEPLLVRSFLQWLRGDIKNEVYDRLYDFFQRDYPSLDLKGALLRNYGAGLWKISGALGVDTLPDGRFNVVLFDAFSGKSTPTLWSEDFLNLLLERATEEACVFSTYACTGVLKRALAGAGFKVEKRQGFQGKRDSTIGTKGL